MLATRPPAILRRTVEIICCPRCTSDRVSPYDNASREHQARWQCRDCKHYWYEKRAQVTTRVYALVEPPPFHVEQ